MADIFSTQKVLVDASPHHHGLALWPPPSSDPRDPLRWPRYTKLLALFSVALANFVANFAGSGFSVASVVFEHEFGKTAAEVNAFMTFNFLLLGIGNMVWVPLSVKLGKRPVMLVSLGVLFAVLVWTARARSFEDMLVARCISGFASAAGESIVPGVVSDMFYLHERGAMMAIYVILISCGSAIGPLVAGFMVDSNWRDFVWLCAALAGLDLFLVFFLYPESSFVRPQAPEPTERRTKEEVESTAQAVETREEASLDTVKVSYPRVWTSFWHWNPVVSLPRAIIVPFVFLGCVPVLWTILVYGGVLASQIILIFAFPSLLLAPPYLFSSSSVGLVQIAAVIGFALACYGGGYLCDVITARCIVRKRGVFVPEMRLVSLAPGCLVAPMGCVLVAFACDRLMHWAVIAVGFGMLSFGTVYAPNIAMTYLLDGYPAFAQEILVAVNVSKNLVAFLFLYVAVDWIEEQGWIQVYMVMFMVTGLGVLLAVPMYFWGHRARASFGGVLRKALGSIPEV